MAHTKETTKVVNSATVPVTPYCAEDNQVWPCDVECARLGIGQYSFSRPARTGKYASTHAEGQAAGFIGYSGSQERSY